MSLNIGSTPGTVTSDGSSVTFNDGTRSVFAWTSSGEMQVPDVQQSFAYSLGNSWTEMPSITRGGNVYRRATKNIGSPGGSGSGTYTILTATPNYGWSQNSIRVYIRGYSYLGSGFGDYFYNSDGSASGNWTPYQYNPISVAGGPTASLSLGTITRSGNTVDTDYYTYPVIASFGGYVTTTFDVEWLSNYFSPVTSITGKYQIALL